MKTKLIALLAFLALWMTSQVLAAPPSEGQSGTTLTATKTATAHLITTYNWTIDKSVSPDTWNLFAGDSGTSSYTVAVTKDAGTTSAYIDGEICVTNGGAVATENLTIVDNVSMPPSQTVIASDIVDTSDMPILAAGASYCYPYRVDIASPVPGATYKDTANITITNHSGHLGAAFGPNPSATSVMPATPTLVNDSITVDDTNGSSWTFNDDGSVTYDKTFTCDDEGTNDNTATIRETGQSDSASVDVHCYSLSVAKTAVTSFDRTWSWTVDKSADKPSLTLSTGQVFTVGYTVVYNATSADSNYAVNGEITISNPAPMDASLTGVVDSFAGLNASVSCPSMTVPAGGSLVCTYSIPLTAVTNGTNTATATQQNYDYAADGTATASGTTDYSGSAAVAFSSTPSNIIDECITVSDSYAGSTVTGTVCADAAPKTFTYSRDIGPYQTCGSYTVDNTATFVTNDTGSTGSDSVSIPVTVPCNTGCTLTQGYWKTHSARGPAPYDDAWLNIGPLGADTPFYSEKNSIGKTYYQVLWTAPQGNVYYILADQYIAAKLNVLNGAATTPEVDAALAGAESFFGTYIPASKLTKAQITQLQTWAKLLDNYNNGLVGPGHCSE